MILNSHLQQLISRLGPIHLNFKIWHHGSLLNSLLFIMHQNIEMELHLLRYYISTKIQLAFVLNKNFKA
jgi:hypothetical protein